MKNNKISKLMLFLALLLININFAYTNEKFFLTADTIIKNEENDLFIKPSKIIVYAAIGAMFAFMGGIAYFSTYDIPELEKSELELLSVNVVEIDSIENRLYLEVVFGITNHGERTVTVPEISFELFADGTSLGASSYSVSDIPMTGRALMTTGLQVPLVGEITINQTEAVGCIIQKH